MVFLFEMCLAAGLLVLLTVRKLHGQTGQQVPPPLPEWLNDFVKMSGNNSTNALAFTQKVT